MLAPCFRLGPSCSLGLQTDLSTQNLEAEGGCEARRVTWMTCCRACAWVCCLGHFVFVDPRNPRVRSCSCSGNTGFCCTCSALVAYVPVPEVLNTLLPAVPSQSSSKHCPEKIQVIRQCLFLAPFKHQQTRRPMLPPLAKDNPLSAHCQTFRTLISAPAWNAFLSGVNSIESAALVPAKLRLPFGSRQTCGHHVIKVVSWRKSSKSPCVNGFRSPKP